MLTRTVLQQADVTRALTRIAHEILETNRGGSDLVLLGIPTRGVLLADRISKILEGLEPGSGTVGALDVTMYRDDLSRQPTRTPQPTKVPARRHRRQDRRAGRRRPLLGSHHPRSTRRPQRPRPPASGPPRGARRPGTPRTADPRRLRGQEPAHRGRRAHQRDAERDRRRRRCHDRRPAQLGGDPMSALAPALGTRPRPGGGHRHPGCGRGHGGCRDPRGPQAAHPARPDGREPVLRGLDPHPDQLRGGRQAPLGRRHHLQREGLERVEGREPEGHRADHRGDGGGCGGAAAQRVRRRARARRQRLDRRRRRQRRRRDARAPDPGAARRLHDAQAAPRRGITRPRPRRGARDDRRRHPALAGRAVERLAAADPRARASTWSPRRRCCRPASTDGR